MNLPKDNIDEILDLIKILIEFEPNKLPKFIMDSAEAKAKLEALIRDKVVEELEKVMATRICLRPDCGVKHRINEDYLTARLNQLKTGDKENIADER